MAEAEWFHDFCKALPPGATLRTSISDRTARITRRLNTDFRATISDTANRFYGGSYGRNTAVASVSDIDLMYVLPYEVMKRYNEYAGNGQSALLQAVRASLSTTYPNSVVVADGQIVQIPFTDGITYEVVPVIQSTVGYIYADANNGGSWKTCYPKEEINAFSGRDAACNYNLVELGRMMRAWRDFLGVPMSGMLLDTLAYQFIENYQYRDKSYLYYDFLVRDFFAFVAGQNTEQQHWRAPGSQSYAYRKGKFEPAAKLAHTITIQAIESRLAGNTWTAKNKYRLVFGKKFPE